jgi:hypothetical protein
VLKGRDDEQKEDSGFNRVQPIDEQTVRQHLKDYQESKTPSELS